MVIDLPPALGTIDLPADSAVIELTAPPLSVMVDYLDTYYLVDEVGNNLVDESANKLTGLTDGQTRSNVIELKD